ncbi:hypothetical protein ACMU_15025 [Actibacterium mucosum KCTC 23349]|uniref:UPF0102 protein ACMU_15025 n=1 Tax=Actibacterium mucosum KCTC 23349 TaxID=1454373 RepID=A0A037ZJR1_9RHOB|nr:YraN family protein [Actibacterium mucosum]KAJ55066.1 hypothetical protein ACMU_15025 [Actibacterium mucosum KCTC 23349]
MTGKTSYLNGHAAEDIVARHYAARGYALLARRWRGQAGEIDLIVADGDGLIFVEVKAARDHATAAAKLRPAQMQRLLQAGAEFAGTQPRGQLTPMRFDAALVDRSGTVEILENAFSA